MEKSRHTALVKELIAALKAEPAPEFKGKKIIVTGIQVEPYDVLDHLTLWFIGICCQ